MKKILEVQNILRDLEFTTKVQLFMSSKAAGDSYDEYEQNHSYTNLNPIIIKAYVKEISPEALVYKQYGLHQIGAKEIICELRYKNMFLNCNKIIINNDTYQVFKEGGGSRAIMQERAGNLLRVVVMRNG